MGVPTASNADKERFSLNSIELYTKRAGDVIHILVCIAFNKLAVSKPHEPPLRKSYGPDSQRNVRRRKS